MKKTKSSQGQKTYSSLPFHTVNQKLLTQSLSPHLPLLDHWQSDCLISPTHVPSNPPLLRSMAWLSLLTDYFLLPRNLHTHIPRQRAPPCSPGLCSGFLPSFCKFHPPPFTPGVLNLSDLQDQLKCLYTCLKGMDSSHCDVQLKTCLIQERNEFKRHPPAKT